MGFFKSLIASVKSHAKTVATFALALFGISAFAETGTGSTIVENTVTVPGGIDISALINSGVMVLGGIVAVALAAWAGWLIVRIALRWIRTAMK